MFEKHLIELYITENSADPVTNEELTIDDLVEVKTARAVAPRPPTLTSIPSLLSTLQKEWDALSIETFKIKQELVQTRQQLSTALYQHDAAVRVIATLQRERDLAREALSQVTVNGSSTLNGSAMQIDAPKLSDALIDKITTAREEYVAIDYNVHTWRKLTGFSGSVAPAGIEKFPASGPLARRSMPSSP